MAEEKLLSYKGRPLARKGNDLYLGNPEDPIVLYLQIVESEKRDGQDMATRVQVMLLSTDPNLSMKERILRMTERNSLYTALDIGSIWLERALQEIH